MKSLSSETRPYGEIHQDAFKYLLESIESIVKECGFSTLLLNRDLLNWGKGDIIPEELMKKIRKNLESSDILLAYPEDSRGSDILIGWASLMDKKIVILVNGKERVSIAYDGLNSIANTRIVKFKDVMDMKNKLANTLKEFSPVKLKEIVEVHD